MTDTCPEGHSLRNGDRLLSECYICQQEARFWEQQLARAELYAAQAELRAAGVTHFADLGFEPTPHFLPEAERLRRFARDT